MNITKEKRPKLNDKSLKYSLLGDVDVEFGSGLWDLVEIKLLEEYM